MNLIKSLILAATFSVAAYATNFDLNSLTPTGPIHGNTPAADYKFDVNPDAESGDLALVNALTTTVNGLTATIEWSPAGSIDLDVIYLKAGNQYIYWDVSSIDWSAYTGFYVTNSWITNPNGTKHPLLGISHIALNGDTRRVPDAGATIVFLTLGIAGLGLAIRRKALP